MIFLDVSKNILMFILPIENRLCSLVWVEEKTLVFLDKLEINLLRKFILPNKDWSFFFLLLWRGSLQYDFCLILINFSSLMIDKEIQEFTCKITKPTFQKKLLIYVFSSSHDNLKCSRWFFFTYIWQLHHQYILAWIYQLNHKKSKFTYLW